jgi:hypothetical protein
MHILGFLVFLTAFAISLAVMIATFRVHSARIVEALMGVERTSPVREAHSAEVILLRPRAEPRAEPQASDSLPLAA